MSRGSVALRNLGFDARLSAASIAVTVCIALFTFAASLLLHTWWLVQVIVLSFMALGLFFRFSSKRRHLNHLQIGMFIGLLAGVVISGAFAL